ncbi:MAG: histone deacetylase [Drouetiella hepatica Uher 2000/2452]|jgi:acetoin utilization deacetylase AcuC-like enzyme|uniref:Histone deacetylase n=1 Tax=Drouetiella hepatica Uher 2000/2452 TaxID=904376 RepID=A0A951UKN2_9CYAN|nr:histone deacetylase [Drouetiella hepatica Uher 2000/2452]
MPSKFPIFYSNEFLEHDTGAYHPERSGRLTAITQALRAQPWSDRLEWRLPTPVLSQAERLTTALRAVHPDRYTEAVRLLSDTGGGHIDPDTVASPRSYGVALLAVSAWLDGVEQVLQSGEPAFVAARPPGHHALPERGMGFCIFANAAIAALYALQQPEIQRVAIVDWDVHHGNGTQAIVESHADIAFCSLHEFPQYPGTGAAHECGKYHNVMNFPMRSGSTIEDYLLHFEQSIIPFLQRFQPDLLIVSAGYDANQSDPLANIDLQPQDYGALTDCCLQVTRRILFGLEGGYDFEALAQSVTATIERCLA